MVKEQTFAQLEKQFNKAVSEFEALGASSIRIEDWSPKETLAHFIHWMDYAARQIESISAGGQPERVSWTQEHMATVNAEAVAQYAQVPISEVGSQVRKAYEKLLKAAQALPSLDTPVAIRANGETLTARNRLDLAANHLLNHLKEYQAKAEGR
ncbi:MAG: ClbS/DfsB family four-helix bundle protein [Chloroflexi bacterium]|nr:ClbS/DfsB family four-helix bundle protein [Chloroflexota bacterium]